MISRALWATGRGWWCVRRSSRRSPCPSSPARASRPPPAGVPKCAVRSVFTAVATPVSMAFRSADPSTTPATATDRSLRKSSIPPGPWRASPRSAGAGGVAESFCLLGHRTSPAHAETDIASGARGAALIAVPPLFGSRVASERLPAAEVMGRSQLSGWHLGRVLARPSGHRGRAAQSPYHLNQSDPSYHTPRSAATLRGE